MAKYKCKSFSIPKHGNTFSENEDNILVPEKTESKTLRCAISDGATESSFSKEWSKLLVVNYSSKLFGRARLHDTIKQLSRQWHNKVHRPDLPWYAQQKLETGAFATFIGLTIDLKEKIIDGVAIGDSTMFLIRKNKLLLSFPITSLKEFGNTPNLLATNNNHQSELANTVHYFNMVAECGDLIVLASDAIAEWIFRELKKYSNTSTIKKLKNKTEAEFESWLNRERNSGNIKNDDTTIIFLKI